MCRLLYACALGMAGDRCNVGLRYCCLRESLGLDYRGGADALEAAMCRGWPECRLYVEWFESTLAQA